MIPNYPIMDMARAICRGIARADEGAIREYLRENPDADLKELILVYPRANSFARYEPPTIYRLTAEELADQSFTSAQL